MTSANLEALWDAYCSRLLAFIRGRVADPSEAEDLLQEVFLRVHNHLCCLPPPEKMDRWIFQIARNLIIDQYRKHRELVELPPDLSVEEALPESEVERELAGSLKEMIEELPEAYREALVLTEYEGLNQVQLSRRLGISLPGAKSRIQRARAKLRDMLLACCHFELDRRGGIIDYYQNCCCCNPEC
jgi:RNA polymerase sigma-70 factor (ECF subfamily)